MYGIQHRRIRRWTCALTITHVLGVREIHPTGVCNPRFVQAVFINTRSLFWMRSECVDIRSRHTKTRPEAGRLASIDSSAFYPVHGRVAGPTIILLPVNSSTRLISDDGSDFVLLPRSRLAIGARGRGCALDSESMRVPGGTKPQAVVMRATIAITGGPRVERLTCEYSSAGGSPVQSTPELAIRPAAHRYWNTWRGICKS